MTTEFDHDLLRKLQLTEVEILDEIVRICDKHDLQYFLIGGTLLGAVRHQGFIPWDDDLDIAMPRKDYNKFKKICKTEVDSKFYLHSIDFDDKYWVSFVKMRKKDTLFEPEQDATIDSPYKGVYVDIFPLDNASKELGLFQTLRVKMCKGLTSFQYRRRNATMITKTPTVIKLLSPILGLFSIKTLSKFNDSLMAFNKNDNAPYFINIGSFINYKKQTMPKEKYLPSTEVLFEGKYYSAPKDYDYVLHRLYGDYMQLPLENKRKTHKPRRIEL